MGCESESRHCRQIVALALWLVVACSEVPKTGPTPLIGPLQSHMQAEVAREKLGAATSEWIVIEQSSLPEGDQRPRFDIERFRVTRFEHLGVAGELVLEFFNDRLMSTSFFPNEWEAYVERLEEHIGQSLEEGQDLEIGSHTRLFLGPTFHDRRYVGWVDAGLASEKNTWISKYS